MKSNDNVGVGRAKGIKLIVPGEAEKNAAHYFMFNFLFFSPALKWDGEW